MNLLQRLRRRPLDAGLSLKSREAALELQRLGLWDTDALWSALAPAWSCDSLLGDVNRARVARGLPALERVHVAEALACAAQQDAEGPMPQRAWRAVFLPSVALLVVWGFWTRPAPQQVVVVTKALPAYHVLTASDVTTTTAAFVADAPADPATVVGRYAPHAIGKNEVLKNRDLIDGRRVPGLDARRIVTLPVSPVDAKRVATLPAVVAIETAAKAAADSGVQPPPILGAYLLAVAADGKTATFALTPYQLERLRPALSRFDLLVVWAMD